MKVVLVFFCFLLISCSSGIKITFTDNDVKVGYTIETGKTFMDTIAALSEMDTEEVVLDSSLIKEYFVASGFTNVKSENLSPSSIKMDFTVPQDGNVIRDSDLILTKKNRNYLELTPLKLLTLYQNLPSELQAYLDLFMAPVFSGESMSNGEYIDLIASVYGEDLANEIKKSTIEIVLNRNNIDKSFKIPLLKLINLKESLILD